MRTVNEELSSFKKKFMIEDLIICESNYWVWSLRPNQTTIGSGILSLKRECSSLGNVEAKEFEDLEKIIKVIESTTEHAFNYSIMNYLMLMMVDKHLHYHVIPRYERVVTILGESWEDECWPSPPNLAGANLDKKTLLAIRNYMKEFL